MERLSRVTQARAIVVSYEGGRDQMLGVLNGTLDLGIGEIQEMPCAARAGPGAPARGADGDPGAGATRRRDGAEQGVDVVVTKFRGLAGPRNLPPNVLKAWHDGIKAVLADPAYQKEYRREGLSRR